MDEKNERACARGGACQLKKVKHSKRGGAHREQRPLGQGCVSGVFPIGKRKVCRGEKSELRCCGVRVLQTKFSPPDCGVRVGIG